MDPNNLQEILEEAPAQRENLRQFIDKLVNQGYTVGDAEGPDPALIDPGGRAVETWREDYPYDELLTRDAYEAEKYLLQVELLKLQYWSQDNDVRHILLFEGRDAAGKGGTIKRFMEHLNPRAARVVALTKPTTTEQGQWYFQRYINHFPTSGEIVMFDRSWYNRAGVERVMGFADANQVEEFLRAAPLFEEMLIRDGITLVKYWFSVSDDEQERRFQKRLTTPTKRWKLSPMDIASRAHWQDYSQAKDLMFARTDTDLSPWWVIDADVKRHARLNCISHLLSMLPYEDLSPPPLELPPRPPQKGEHIRPPKASQRYVPELY